MKKQRRDEKANKAQGELGVDPDIADIMPGPQPIDWEEEAQFFMVRFRAAGANRRCKILKK